MKVTVEDISTVKKKLHIQVPPDAIAAGVPARVLRFRSDSAEPVDLETVVSSEA